MLTWLLGAAKLLLVAQSSEAAVVGTVRDSESGEPVAGAVVTLPDLGKTAVSDGRGRYAIRSVAPGPQHITVRRMGYTPRGLHALVPRSGELEVNVALRRHPVLLRRVDVRPPVAMRGMEGDAAAEFPERSVSSSVVRTHPMLAEPDVFLALGGGDVVMRAEAPSGLHIRGGASDQTGYQLDGIPVFSPYHTAGMFSAWNPDALARVHLSSSQSGGAETDALSSTVRAVTRTPGSRVSTQGSVSTTQARLTADGPLGFADGGFLISVRSGFPGFIIPERESSYLRGESGDVIAKAEARAFGGRARILYYDNANEIGAAAEAGGSAPNGEGLRRHAFEWNSQSVGIEWVRRIGPVDARFQSWTASGTAQATWELSEDSSLALRSDRRDFGVGATGEWTTARATTIGAVRIRTSRTSYDAGLSTAAARSLSLEAQTPTTSFFMGHRRALPGGMTADVALSTTAASRTTFLDPHVLMRWAPSSAFGLSAAYARTHQFTQSLRNAESVIGTVFPADLFVGANRTHVPVARGDEATVAGELRPAGGLRLGARAYRRAADGLVLVAPRSPEPFATSDFATGSGESHGGTLDASMSSARYGLLVSYGWQQTRFDFGDSSYVPEHAATHVFEGGGTAFPSPTVSLRIGAMGAVGRRATGVLGVLEAEGCNLLDLGCELAGTPRAMTRRLGGASLSTYLRVDVSVRKHWDLDVASRQGVIAVFGTVTNVFGRKNRLTAVTDPSTHQVTAIGMRPFAPLVVGVDWRF